MSKFLKWDGLKRFILLCVLILSYASYLSIQYDVITGGVASIITWSFFVLCTPIADAGFLLDFPLKLLFGIQMIVSEIVVWSIAIGFNLFIIFGPKHYYQTTGLTKVFYKILTHPYPYWAIIALSCVGTFLSLFFGDEIIDSLSHKQKMFFKDSHLFYKNVALGVVFVSSIILYYFLLKSMHLEIFS